jgi:hypothetical protein
MKLLPVAGGGEPAQRVAQIGEIGGSKGHGWASGSEGIGSARLAVRARVREPEQ